MSTHLTNKWHLSLYYAVLVLFVIAIVISLISGEHNLLVGTLLLVVGAIVIQFSRLISEVQQELSKQRYFPSRREEVRPLTLILWGTGVFILGLANIFLWR